MFKMPLDGNEVDIHEGECGVSWEGLFDLVSRTCLFSSPFTLLKTDKQ